MTLLEVHKLMYFMQEAGERLRLKYQEAPYGPYAENLRHLLHTIEGHFISGYADGGDAPDKQLELVPGAVEEAHTFSQATRKRTNVSTKSLSSSKDSSLHSVWNFCPRSTGSPAKNKPKPWMMWCNAPTPGMTGRSNFRGVKLRLRLMYCHRRNGSTP